MTYHHLHGKAKSNGMDHTVSALNINWVIGIGTKRLLADNSIIDKVFTNGITVFQWHATQTGQIGRGDGTRRNVSLDDVKFQYIGGDGTTEKLVGFEGGVGGSKDGEGSGAGDFVGNTGGLKGGVEFAKVFIALEVGLFLADGDTWCVD
jgi:hypothetical protein